MKKYFILAAAVLTMTACSNDENENSVKNDDAINLTASVAGATATRAGVAVQSTYFEGGELINVECTPNDGTTDGTMVSAIYETGAAATSTTVNALSVYTGSTALTWPALGTVSLKAFYPSDVTSSSTTFSVQEDQSTDATNGDANYKASDLMYSTPITGQTKQSAAVELTFHHALTKIIVNLTPGSGMTNTDVAACTVKLHAKKTVAIASGVASTDPSDVSNDATIIAGTGTEVADNSGVKTYGVAAIIVPQTIIVPSSTDPDPVPVPVDFITVTTAGNHSVTYKLSTDKAFAAGNVYTYNFTVGISGLLLQSTQIIDWDGGENNANTVNAGSLTL
jgi:hypothetical protein